MDILGVTFTLRLGCPPSLVCDTSSLLVCNMCMCTRRCPVMFLVPGRAHPNTDKWLFQKWCQEVDVEEVLTATLPNEPVSGDEELDVYSNPLSACPPGKEVKKKEVQSSDSEVDLFAPPPTAPVPNKKAKSLPGGLATAIQPHQVQDGRQHFTAYRRPARAKVAGHCLQPRGLEGGQHCRQDALLKPGKR